MKRLNVFMILFIGFGMTFTTGCKKIGPPIVLHIKGPSAKTKIPANPLTGTFELVSADEHINLDSAMKEYHAAAFNVTKASLEEANFSVTAPANGNLNSLESVSISILSGDMPEVMIAHKDHIDKGLNSVDLEMTGSDIAPYIKAGSFKYKTKFTISSPVTQDMEISATSKFRTEMRLD